MAVIVQRLSAKTLNLAAQETSWLKKHSSPSKSSAILRDMALVGEAARTLERKAEGSYAESPSKKVAIGSAASGANAAGSDAPPQSTDEKLDRLMAMMQCVAMKEDLAGMETSLLQKVDTTTKASIAEAVDPLKPEMHDLHARVLVLEQPQGGGDPWQDTAAKSKIDQIEKELAMTARRDAEKAKGLATPRRGLKNGRARYPLTTFQRAQAATSSRIS